MGLLMWILQLCPEYHCCPRLVIRLCGLSSRLSFCSLPRHQRCKVSSSESELSHCEEDITGEDENAEADKGGVETSSNGQVASDGEEGQESLKLKTPSWVLARSSVDMRTQTQSLIPGRKSSPFGESSTQKGPKRTAPLRHPVNHLLRKSHQQMRHSMMRPGKKLSCWTHVLMLGVKKRLLKVSWPGPPETP